MAKILRSVGSSETNQKLQNVMFHYSQKHELFEKERAIYKSCDLSLHAATDEAKNLLILPLKVRFTMDDLPRLFSTNLCIVAD